MRAGGGRGAVPAPDARPAGTRRRRRAGRFPEGPHLGRRPARRIPPGGAARPRRSGPPRLGEDPGPWPGHAAAGRPGGAGTPASQPFPSLPCAGGGLTTPESLLISAGPFPSEERLKERAPFGQGLREGSRRGQKEQSWRPSFLANPLPPNGFLVPTLPPPPSPCLAGLAGLVGLARASDTLESPRSELRAWPPSQANSREEGGAA